MQLLHSIICTVILCNQLSSQLWFSISDSVHRIHAVRVVLLLQYCRLHARRGSGLYGVPRHHAGALLLYGSAENSHHVRGLTYLHDKKIRHSHSGMYAYVLAFGICTLILEYDYLIQTRQLYSHLMAWQLLSFTPCLQHIPITDIRVGW